jgi:uroporphyrinogen decarboxylase
VTRRQRVTAALRGEPVDRPPLAFWLHNFATENSAEGLADETLRLHRAFDWDFLKPQSRAQCFAEMWGLTYAPSGDKARPYTVTYAPVATADDLARLPVADPGSGALGEQLAALRLIRAAVGPDVPIIWTVFAPPMILPMLARGGRAQALGFLREAPRETARAFDVMADTLAEYARRCLAAGADGRYASPHISAKHCARDCGLRKSQPNVVARRTVSAARPAAEFSVAKLWSQKLSGTRSTGAPRSAAMVRSRPVMTGSEVTSPASLPL